MPEQDKNPQELDEINPHLTDPPSDLAETRGEALPAASPSSDFEGVTGDAPGSGGFPLPYLVVAIGASAGGLEAYIELLSALPDDTGMAFVLVPHLAAAEKSHLVEILSTHTAMPVEEASAGKGPEPNHVYVIPPDARLSIAHGLLRLEPRAGDRNPKPIDYFFHSLASDQKNRAIGVVLSGTASDGALGLRAIKGEGGISIVQQPESARFGDMPRSGIAADHVDLVLPPGQIGIELARLAARFRDPELQPLEEGALPSGEEHDFARIVTLLRGVSGIEFRQYKPATLRRRVARRMMLKRISALGEYLRFLQKHSDELRELQEDILINVTRFFRDPDVWETLKNDIFPRLFEGRPPNQQVRIWVPGCASGEEAYSICMSLLEYVASQSPEPPIQIFGTDASERSIERARAGIYPESSAADVSPDRLRRFFQKVDKGYRVSKRVRDLCIFARQNLCIDPPFSRLDLVSCRNVLIYLTPELQKQIIPTFHYALRPDGYLLLGCSEAIRNFSDLFSLVDRRHKFYARIGTRSWANLELAARPLTDELSGLVPESHAHERDGWTEVELQRAADRIVLARYGPAGVIVNERMEILQSRGHTAPFLEMAPGAASLQLVRMIRESIAIQVRDAVRRAIDLEVPIKVEGLELRENGDTLQLKLDVLPLQSLSSRGRFYLVLFVPAAPSLAPPQLHTGAPVIETADEREKLLAELRHDLTATKFYLQALLEERDAKNQELVSANEEVQSANEELQSTNEELQTTKEELQSANEELQTINDELHQRNTILSQTSNDLMNLLNGVSLPVLMLDGDLRVRHFTPPTERLVSLRAADIGRPLSDIRLHLKVNDLESTLHEVLDTLVTKELEVQDREGRWYLMRIRPYRTSDNKIEGVLLVLIDISQLRLVQQELLQARDYARAVVEGVQIPLVVLTSDLKVRTANSAFRLITGLPMEELENRSFPELGVVLWGMENLRTSLEQLVRDAQPNAGLEFVHETRAPENRSLCVNVRTVLLNDERLLTFTVEDITTRRKAEQLLESEHQRLAGEVQSTTEALVHTQAELRALTGMLFTSQEDERRRVARELHDDVSQQLALLQIELDQCYQRFSKAPDQVHNSLGKLRDRTASLSDEVRRISHRLHPSILEDLGLPHALKALVEEFAEREGMLASFSRRDVPAEVPNQVAATLYRIAQEALRNVSKHAGKTHAKVTLEGTDSGLRLAITDLGEGFDPEDAPRGLGLISMAERARLIHGTFSVQSALGKGTTVTVEVPLPASEG